MTDLHDRILSAAYPLFVSRGIRDVSIDDVQRAAGVSSSEFSREFASRDALATECLELREREWTIGVVVAGARSRGTTPEGRLLAIFDVFEEWFHRDDYEACTFVSVLLEMGKDHPLGAASAGHLLTIRRLVATLADEAQLRDADDFALSMHILMKGSIVNAVEGDRDAAARAKEMARDLIARHRSHDLPRELTHTDVDWFDGCLPDAGFLDVQYDTTTTPEGSHADASSVNAAEDAGEDAPPAVPAVTWGAVRRDLWVGRQDGEFAGMVEEIAGNYSATSRHGKFVGTFPTLGEAQDSLSAEATSPAEWWI
ncbi:TetR/AcrR family transcriptional regulator [Planctomonas psychrotolerans]|uniref:TetR/AcrR family transcriptional regulator n=1 Tax=Planctomonas psychrotolerans TaxID=2528712 RepID=UPI001D0D71BB|nr:TetR/AcrR family transcriptional regulator [Planctomonas psychrotolerans]